MSDFTQRIRPYVQSELDQANENEGKGETARAFTHLERAHVLGQASTVEHVRVHWAMFCWAWRHHQPRELAGQVLRIIGAATKTGLGLVPAGNTGGTNVSPFKRLPVTGELQKILESTRTQA